AGGERMAKSSLWAWSVGVVTAAAVFPVSGQILPFAPDAAVGTLSCERRLQRVADAQGLSLQPGERLVSDRAGRLRRDPRPAEVRMHYLVDRQIGGCPVPVVSPTRLDEANRAVGRVVGLDPGLRR
ncbi:MAG TPA: hypothetical protein VLJ13_12360, partial [Brevundimonas sp.]|nr:hypothetical protein [Brevundimonas sp.]